MRQDCARPRIIVAGCVGVRAANYKIAHLRTFFTAWTLPKEIQTKRIHEIYCPYRTGVYMNQHNSRFYPTKSAGSPHRYSEVTNFTSELAPAS